MQNKLQELTDKLYNEGLSKGKQEAEELKSKAKEEAEKIISQANAQAAQIVEKAEKEAVELKTKVNNDLKMASTQTISAIKQQVETVVTTKVINNPTKTVMSDPDFIKSIITTIIKAFNANNPDSVSLEMILPASMQKDLESFVKNEIAKQLTAGVNVEFSKAVPNGFKIGPKDGGYMLSFTGDDFESMIGSYIRPATKKILFGK